MVQPGRSGQGEAALVAGAASQPTLYLGHRGGRAWAFFHTGAGEDNGIDHNQNWLRFPYDSTV
jgi:hypothetical protein